VKAEEAEDRVDKEGREEKCDSRADEEKPFSKRERTRIGNGDVGSKRGAERAKRHPALFGINGRISDGMTDFWRWTQGEEYGGGVKKTHEKNSETLRFKGGLFESREK